jgi:3-oxoacyl-[acyl-carrier protein] reductase
MAGEWRLLVFGASGAIGQTVVKRALARGWSVTCVTRGALPDDEKGVFWRSWDPITNPAAGALANDLPFDGVCWAQGANLADSLNDFDIDRHRALYDANVTSVLVSAATLIASNMLRSNGARLAVVSSIWQERARDNKLSYTVSKAALGGLVRAASVDLGPAGHLINAVLPGVLDTPMTRANLSSEQIGAVAAKTTLGRLPDLETLADTILFLCSVDNNSISGQSLAVDLGMSNASLF